MTATELKQRIDARTARVGVIGLGYVGLPLAVEFASAGFEVTGFDVDTAKVAYTRTNPNSWGLTTNPYKFDPPINSPSELKTHLEPSERPGDEVGCYMQDQPVHKLVNWQNKRILSISAEGTYHRVFDVCIPKWLNQAGAKVDFIRLEDVGIRGNMHEMFLDRNSDEVIKFIDTWLKKNIK